MRPSVPKVGRTQRDQSNMLSSHERLSVKSRIRQGCRARQFGELCPAEGRPGLDGAERNALVVRFCLRPDVHAALREPFLEHRRDVHEWLDGNSLDALRHEFSEGRVVTGHGLAGDAQQRAQSEVTRLAHVPE